MSRIGEKELREVLTRIYGLGYDEAVDKMEGIVEQVSPYNAIAVAKRYGLAVDINTRESERRGIAKEVIKAWLDGVMDGLSEMIEDKLRQARNIR
jgi:hypothetical protein